ncbi:MAG TPA: trypsin-like peptidase domain-containing protein [Jatrophihabitans sp.]|jgi:putative serine protease PepD|uniref:S1C family serine protease n=1 Tax=Jatrophihabitans sp. TaxID=1932789 RepID=UPI002F1147EE
MNSNEYPPPPPSGDDSAAPESDRAPERVEPFSHAYEPVQPVTRGYEPGQPAAGGGSGYASGNYDGGSGSYDGGYQQGYYPPAPAFQPHTQPSGGDFTAPGYPPPAQAYQPVQHTQQLPRLDGPALAAEPAGRRRRGRTLLITALLAALLGGGVGGGVVAIAERDQGDSVNIGLRITNATGAPAAQLDGTIGAAAAKIRPSVVTIGVSGGQESGTGSGVIIRQDGYILTNDHVVSIGNGTGDLQVMLADGRSASAKIIGRDPSDDLAVIKVEGLSNLPAATFAKSSSLSVGQTVVAVGAPLGLSDTVTSGIVSNLSRPVRAGDQAQAVFAAVQTDAAINPGNSGGPLVDLNGSVVGINAAIATESSGGLQIPGQQAGNIGIGFAIPSDEASRIASELIATGKATRAVLGVEVGGNQSTTQSQSGVPLRAVSPSGAASKVGLKVGDIITSVDGRRVTTADSLIAAIRNHAPGERVKITYVRAGKAAEVEVTLGSTSS